LGLAAWLGACATGPSVRRADRVIAAVEAGAGDPCTGAGAGLGGLIGDRASIELLKARVTARLDREAGDTALPEAAVRLAGLENTARALAKIGDPRDWAEQRQGAMRWALDVNRRAQAAHEAPNATPLGATGAKLSAYGEAAARNVAFFDVDPVGASLRGCALSPLHRAARLDYGAALIGRVAAGGFADERRDGPGALHLGLDISPQFFTAAGRDRACLTLEEAARAGASDRGAWVFMRARLSCRNGLAGGPSEMVDQFEADWPALSSFLLGLPRSTPAEELRLRVELDRYGRSFLRRLYERFPDAKLSEAERARALAPLTMADVDNTARLKALLAGRDWFDDAVDGLGAAHWGWALVQNADSDPAFQKRVLDRLESEIGAGGIDRSEYAHLWDRVAAREGRPQRFATQVWCQDGRIAPVGGVEDEAGLDQRRAAFGIEWSWAEYQEMIGGWTNCRPS
jgi:hypothetical protein